MKTRKWPSLLMAALTALSFGACQDWGETDPPAGNQVYPKLEQVAQLTFDGDELNPEEIQPFAYNGGDVPTLTDDALLGRVLHLSGGYARIFNPLNRVKVQNGVSLTFWVKQPALAEGEEQDLTSALIAFENENATQRMFFTANGWLSYAAADGTYNHNNPAEVKTGMMKAGEWNFVALAVTNNGYFVYVNGEKKIEHTETNFDCSRIVRFMASVPYLYIGYGAETEPQEMWMDNLRIYRNTITKKEWTAPKPGGQNGGGEDPTDDFPTPVYFNNFESGAGDATVYGSGGFKQLGGKFGYVFSNVGGALRSNYLVLPSDVLSHAAETQAMSISMWVNRGNETNSADYMWAPLFTAYGSGPSAENSWPMLACQYRGVLQVNCAGWSDYTDAQNVAGSNKLYHGDTDWLADGKWHHYTAVFTPTTAKVYIDGVLANAWEIDGVGNTAAGLFSNGADLKYVCLGGNQAWNWGDNDPGFWFDDIAIYNVEITPAHIKRVMKKKQTVYFNDFEAGADDATVYGEGSFIDSGNSSFGKVFSNVGGALRSNYLVLPSDVLSYSAETQALSIAVWVNRGNESNSADYMWAPLFTAYGNGPATENTWPMLACQYRGVLQVNCAGWSDYTDAQNAAGINTLYHGDNDWLADGEWHLYTAVFTPTNAKVYVDGILKNEWNLDGVANTAAGLFSNGADLKYVCLGGNQAWSWGDNDPGFWFDDIAIYNSELSVTDIMNLIAEKKK